MDRTRISIAMKSWQPREALINAISSLTDVVYTAGPAPSGYLEGYLNQWNQDFAALGLDDL